MPTVMDDLRETVPASPSPKRDYVYPSMARSDSDSMAAPAAVHSLNWNAPDETARWSREAGIREYFIEREALVFHPELQLLCQLNETASFLWQYCHRRSICELTDLLHQAYKVEAATARHHVLRVVELFAMNGLISQEASDVVA